MPNLLGLARHPEFPHIVYYTAEIPSFSCVRSLKIETSLPARASKEKFSSAYCRAPARVLPQAHRHLLSFLSHNQSILFAKRPIAKVGDPLLDCGRIAEECIDGRDEVTKLEGLLSRTVHLKISWCRDDVEAQMDEHSSVALLQRDKRIQISRLFII